MTPDTLRERKHKLAVDIKKLVADFEEETGFCVNHIDYEAGKYTNIIGMCIRAYPLINIELDI